MSNATIRSSKYLEQARLRIRFNFQSKFPAALAQEQSSTGLVDRNATDVPRSQADTPLEQARLRIRNRFLAKFPASMAQKQSSNGLVDRHATDVPRSQADTPLEQARLRIRNRFLAKFPASSTLAMGKEEKKQSPVEASLAAANDDKYRNVEEARNRIRNRFKRKFLPDFEAFPTTLDTAIPAMLHEKWGVTNAAVITSSAPPHRIVCVNSCWEELCGFTSEQATGETFASLGIEGSFTDRVMSGYLSQKLEKGERVAVHLKNQTKDGKTFANYLRVTPLTDHSTNEITHFLGVLQDEGNANNITAVQ
jgi:PAS domain S-box-containing protein